MARSECRARNLGNSGDVRRGVEMFMFTLYIGRPVVDLVHGYPLDHVDLAA